MHPHHLRAAVVGAVTFVAATAYAAPPIHSVSARIVNVETATRYEVSVLDNGGPSLSRNHLRISLKGAHANPSTDRLFALRVLHGRRIILSNCSPSHGLMSCNMLIDLNRVGVAPIDGLHYLVALHLAQRD